MAVEGYRHLECSQQGEGIRRVAGNAPRKSAGTNDTTLIAHPAHNCGETESP